MTATLTIAALAVVLAVAGYAAPGTSGPPAPGSAAPRASATSPGAQTPLAQAGAGWALAEFTTGSPAAAAPVTLELVDPSGHTYPVYTFPATTQLPEVVAWSGDKSRVLLGPSGTASEYRQLTLATGKVTTFTLPSGAQVIGYTRPSGQQVLVADSDGVARYSLSGVLQQRLVNDGTLGDTALSSPDGTTEVTSNPDWRTQMQLVSNAGGVIRQLPVPGVSGCYPVRWWDTATVLATCMPSAANSAPQIWLVPVSGAAPTALTPVRQAQGPDLGDVDAWQFPTGLYLQATVGCGAGFIGQQGSGGTVTMVSVPGSDGQNAVAATAGSRMLVREFSTCDEPGSSLVWFEPATGAVQNVLTAPAHSTGVVTVIPFNADGTQP